MFAPVRVDRCTNGPTQRYSSGFSTSPGAYAIADSTLSGLRPYAKIVPTINLYRFQRTCQINAALSPAGWRSRLGKVTYAGPNRWRGWLPGMAVVSQLAINRLSDNVGGVKHFLGILVRALRKSAPFRSR